MIPLKLSFQAFESYVQRQEIDFVALSQDGLFLINGETGAGKTAILDAITYALYGETSGGDRGEVRCLAIEAQDLPTEVEFVFSVRGQSYKFARSLSLKKTDTRSLVRYDQSAGVVDSSNGCFQPFEPSQTRSFVTSKAVELLGLTLEQFRQVILLPQGRFERFLTSESGEKERILAALFSAETFTKICEHLHRDARARQAECDQQEAHNWGLLTGNGFESDCDLKAFLQKLKEENICGQQELRNKRRSLALAKQATLEYEQVLEYANEKKKLTDILAPLSAKRVQWERAMSHVRLAKELAPANTLLEQHFQFEQNQKRRYDDMMEKKHVFQRVSTELSAATDDLSAFKARENESAKRQELIALLRNAREEMQEITAMEGRYSADLAHYDTLLASIKEWQTVYERVEAEILLNTQRKAEIQPLLDEAMEVELAWERLCEAAKLQTEQKALLDEEEAINARIQALEGSLRSKQRHLDALTAKSEQVLESQTQLIIQFLSARLEDGEPCPVCGSRTHSENQTHRESEIPEFSHFNDENSLESGHPWKAVAAELADAQNQVADFRSELSGLKSALDAKRERIAALEKGLQEADFSQSNHRAYEQKHQELRRARAKFSHLNELLEPLERRKNELLEEKKMVDSEFVLAREKVLVAKTELSTKKNADLLGKISRILGQDQEFRAENIEALYGKMCKNEKAHQTGLATANELVNKLFSLNSAARTSYEQAENEYKSAAEATESKYVEIAKILENNGMSTVDELRKALLPADEIARAEEKYAEYNKKVYAVEEQISRLNSHLNAKEHLVEQDYEKLKAEEKSQEIAVQEMVEALAVRGSEEMRLAELLNTYQNAAKKLSVQRVQSEERLTFSSMLQGDRGTSFTRFVLGVMLSLVTSEANRLLRDIHGGQFQLYRKREPGDRRMKSGLDLEVQCPMSAARMQVQNLSGGEKFLISLALSLALANVLQQQSGGVTIEAMFVDEGFGSLDKSSLNEALELLQRLSQAQSGGKNRTIGIISHVAELKQAISARIDVTKDEGGSKVSLRHSNG